MRGRISKTLTAVLLIVLMLICSCASADETIEVPNVQAGGEQYGVIELPYSNSRLYEVYVQKVFGMNLLSAFKTNRRNLTDMEKIVYDAVLSGATSIANGNRASSVFEVPFESAGVKMTWTEEELGVPVVVDGAINAAAIRPILAAYYADKYNGPKVVTALLRDNPFDFYWVSNRVTYSYMTPDGCGMGAKYENGKWTLTVSGNISFSLPVDSQFASGTYSADTSKTGAAVNAMNRANNIIAGGSGMDDVERMTYYMQQLRQLSDYNYDAAAGYAEDSAPWQLIYVFDGDPSTKVVCEGFSKAFQYLCDNTEFENEELSVYTVTGEMDGGPHMWNTVCIDGKNYLVDVTNCDTSGSTTNSLFLSVPVSGDVENGYLMNRTISGYVPQDILYVYGDMYYDESMLELTDEAYVVPTKISAALILMSGDSVKLWDSSMGVSNILNTSETELRVVSAGSNVSCSSSGVLTASSAGTSMVKLAGSSSVITLTVQVKSSMSTLTLPAGLGSLGSNALKNTAAERLVLPSTLSSVGSNAFGGMSGVIIVDVPSGLSSSVLAALPSGSGVTWLCEDASAVSYAASNGIRCVLVNG